MPTMNHSFVVVAVLVAGMLPLARSQATPEVCGGAYLAMQFSFSNYAAYNTYFHSESKMQLAQAGIYTGPVAIEEYVKFANVEHPAIKSDTTVNFTFTLTGINADVCEFFTIGYTRYEFNEIFSNGTLYVVAAFRLYLNTTSGQMDRINVFYETDYLRWIGSMTAFPRYQAHLCNLMESDCPNTWSYNSISSQADCMSRLAALPTTTGDEASFDGNSQACRALHGMLAGLNPDQHCPHVSFLPQVDPNGVTKCQTSSNVPASDLFTPAQMAMLGVFKQENGIPASGFTASIPCNSDEVICPLDHVCVAGVCAEPAPSNSSMNTSDDNSSLDEDEGDEDEDENVTSDSDLMDGSELDSSDACSMRMCTVAFLLLLAACRSTLI